MDILYLLVYLLSQLFNPCSRTNYQPVYSPDKNYYAQVSEFSCGATTGFGTSLYLNKKSLFSSSKRVLFYRREPHDIKLVWIDNNSLTISYTGRCGYYNPEDELEIGPSHWDGIKLQFIDKCNK